MLQVNKIKKQLQMKFRIRQILADIPSFFNFWSYFSALVFLF